MGHLRHKMLNTDSLLEFQPLYLMVLDQECSQSKSQQGEMHGSPGWWCPNQNPYARVHWKSLSGHQAYLRPCGWTSHLHRAGKYLHLTYWLCHHMGSSGWSPGSDSPHSPRFVQLCSSGPCDPGNPHDRPLHECDNREGDRHTGNTWGQYPCDLPFGGSMSDCHIRRWQGHY